MEHTNTGGQTEQDGPEQQADPVAEVIDIGQGLLDQAITFGESLLRTWNLYQVAIAIGIFVVAHVLRAILGPPIRNWMGRRENWAKWRMRILVITHQRLRAIFFVVLIWAVVWTMREITWPSRSYLLDLIATLSFAWLAVVFVTRLIHSPVLRKLVRFGALAWVTLHILGLTEQAARLLETMGVSVGEFRLSLLLLVQVVAILGALVALARIVARSTEHRIRRSQDISPSMQVLIVKALQVGLYGAAFLIGIRAIGIDLTGFAVLSGAIGVGLGFGLQKVVSNLVSGVIILLDKSIKPGDVISLGETFGWINTLGARYTSITTRDGKEFLIPNEDLITGQVVNWSHSNEFVRLDIHFGTSYDDDPHDVRRLAVEAAASVPRVLPDRPPVCHMVGFGDSGVDYILRFWIRDPTGGLTNIRGNVFLALWDTFKANEISIPFPQREVRLLGAVSRRQASEETGP